MILPKTCIFKYLNTDITDFEVKIAKLVAELSVCKLGEMIFNFAVS